MSNQSRYFVIKAVFDSKGRQFPLTIDAPKLCPNASLMALIEELGKAISSPTSHSIYKTASSEGLTFKLKRYEMLDSRIKSRLYPDVANSSDVLALYYE